MDSSQRWLRDPGWQLGSAWIKDPFRSADKLSAESQSDCQRLFVTHRVHSSRYLLLRPPSSWDQTLSMWVCLWACLRPSQQPGAFAVCSRLAHVCVCGVVWRIAQAFFCSGSSLLPQFSQNKTICLKVGTICFQTSPEYKNRGSSSEERKMAAASAAFQDKSKGTKHFISWSREATKTCL